jgi:FkbM family methyltransferase
MNIMKKCRYGMMIYNRKDIWQGRSFDVYGEYSESEVALFRVVVQPGSIVIDVGANMGSLTMPLARIVGMTGAVLAYEPERFNFYTLSGNVALNNLRNVMVFNQAVGKKRDLINVPELDYERTSNFGGLELDKDYSQAPHYPVPMTTIDDIGLNNLHFIKIDVEGMELDVVEGATATINRFRPILYVENDRKEKAPALMKYIEESLKYTMYQHSAPFWNPSNYYGVQENVFGNVVSMNLLCLPSEKTFSFDPKAMGLQPVSCTSPETTDPSHAVVSVGEVS